MPHAQTALGPIDPAELGRVLTHEHLLALVPGPFLSGGTGDDRIEQAVRAVSGLREAGFSTVVDLTPHGLWNENKALMAEISRRSGLHVVVGTAVYLESYSPQWALEADIESLTTRFISDATTGVGDTGVRAGIYGEQATGLDEITPHEEKCLRAAARASAATGLALNTHTTHGTMALEQVAILRSEGADLSRVVIGHMDIHDDLDHLKEILDQGVTLGFDTIGKQWWDFFLGPADENPRPGEFQKRCFYRPDTVRLEHLITLVEAGYAEQIVMSMDLTGAEAYMNPRTHGTEGLLFLVNTFVPALIKAGLRQSDLDLITITNPARLLTLP